jgi:hypothetical protein
MADPTESSENSEEVVPEPPEALISSNPLKWMRYFGPGAIVASCTIGSGEVLFPSRGGTLFGYDILWVFFAACLLKWVMSYTAMRHMILTGAHPLERWTSIAGPRGWFPLFMVIMITVCIPFWYAFLSGVLGTFCDWIFGTENKYLYWAIFFMVIALIIVLFETYKFLENIQMILIATMVLFMFTALMLLHPPWMEVIQGIFIPKSLDYPDWAPIALPSLKDRPVFLEIMMYISAMGGASNDYLSYASYLREKKWGRTHLSIATDSELAEVAADRKHKSRLWLRAALIDSSVSFIVVAGLAACFSILGTIVLEPQHILPAKTELLNHQAEFLKALKPWLEPFYKVAIMAAFIPMLYGGPQMNSRFYYEYFRTLPRFRGRVTTDLAKKGTVCWCLGGGAILLLLQFHVFPDFSLISLVTPAGVYTGVLTCGFFCLANLWADRHFLPRQLRTNGLMVSLNLLAGVIFTFMGLKAMWGLPDLELGKLTIHFGTWWGYSALVLQLCLAMLLAHLLRRFLYSKPSKSIQN